MLLGHADGGLSEHTSSRSQLLSGPECELEDNDAIESSEQILYLASFEELAKYIIKYETVIWLFISLLLVLAWGVGILMLLYLPVRRYILRKDIASRKLYVTPSEIVYKVSRPSFIPLLGITTIEKHIPLSMVIDIIIEQGCLQSMYGIQTFRVESIAHGKVASVDELQIQGVSDPSVLRKVIISEASKSILGIGKTWKPTALAAEGETVGRMQSLNEGSAVYRSPVKSLKMTASPHYSPMDRRSIVPGEFLLHKIEEVNKTVKKLEFLIENSSTPLQETDVKYDLVHAEDTHDIQQ